jgi:hypothetical protein
MARRLLLPLHTYTPYFFNKHGVNFFSLFSKSSTKSFNYFKLSLDSFNYLETNTQTHYKIQNDLSNLQSNTISPARAYLGSLVFKNNQSDVLTNLFDILIKKEYIFKSMQNSHYLNYLIKINQPSLNMPIVYTLKTISTAYEVNNKSTIANFCKNKTIFFKKYTSLNSTYETDNLTLKSQYQPLRKGIVNMIRIQADKAIAMPTDTRLQILAVSKDIIHS